MSNITAFVVCFIGGIALMLLVGCSATGPGVCADMVIVNGKVWTVDKEKPQAEAVAVWQGRILAVGDTADIKSLIGPGTEVLDVGGGLVLPGFSDSHTHFESGGFYLLGVDLKDAVDEDEFGRRLAEASKRLPEGAWITGGNWDHDRWAGGNLPTAELIDRFVPNRPVLVTRYDGHMSVANSAALKLAGVTAATGDPAGGIIVRKSGSQEPAGVLRETAVSLVSWVIPAHTRGEIRQALETALAWDHQCASG